ncbi:PREDICTED: tetraspanin-19-like isoform X1 [Fragaria vesca subsp. vesca]|uniref:tetraspanin-19-like isoform X1 n=1 Tax=Fragaria vesca subsp. vesca TaxID=101020 RepID=UPI0002C368AA|nr:PREDICTED: tetraspanin-19-like isoform X1 [Fragaria vesca subsp. vesca]
MVNCARCCLHNSMRALNFFVNIFAVGVIIYTLWLLKKWQDGVTELPPVPMVLKPWFIYACLGAGIAVCFSTLFSYLVAHCITDSTLLLIYIVSIFSLLCIEVAGVVAIFYKMNWAEKLAEYIKDTKFKNFMIFHLYMCRLIAILILVPQIKCTVLAIILWAIGTEPLTHCNYSDHVTEFRYYSFLVIPSPASLLNMSRNGFRNYEALPRSDQYEYPPRLSFFSRINRFFRMRFHRRVTLG